MSGRGDPPPAGQGGHSPDGSPVLRLAQPEDAGLGVGRQAPGVADRPPLAIDLDQPLGLHFVTLGLVVKPLGDDGIGGQPALRHRLPEVGILGTPGRDGAAGDAEIVSKLLHGGAHHAQPAGVTGEDGVVLGFGAAFRHGQPRGGEVGNSRTRHCRWESRGSSPCRPSVLVELEFDRR